MFHSAPARSCICLDEDEDKPVKITFGSELKEFLCLLMDSIQEFVTAEQTDATATQGSVAKGMSAYSSTPLLPYSPTYLPETERIPSAESLLSGQTERIPSAEFGPSRQNDDAKKSILNRTGRGRREHSSVRRRERKSIVGERKDEREKQRGIFVGEEDLRAQLHKDLDKREYNVAVLYWDTGLSQRLARSEAFSAGTLMMIALNAVWIGVDTDQNTAPTLRQAPISFQVVEHIFCAFFFLEWLVRFLAFRRKLAGFSDGWFRFDSVLMAQAVVETWVIGSMSSAASSPASEGEEKEASGSHGASTVLSMLRLLRLLRLARMVRLMRSIPELLTLLKGMGAATRSVGATLFLLILFLYVFGIAVRQQARGLEGVPVPEYYGSVGACMWTLLMAGTFMDDLFAFFEDTGAASPVLSLLLIVFLLLSALTMLNMLIGVLCEVVSAVSRTEGEALVVQYVKATLLNELEQIAKNPAQKTISKAEFKALLRQPRAQEALEELGVDLINLFENSDFIFEVDELGEENQREGGAEVGQENELAFADFLQMVLRMRANQSVQVVDLLDLRKYMKWSNRNIDSAFQESMEAAQELFLGQSEQVRKLTILKHKLQDLRDAVRKLRPSTGTSFVTGTVLKGKPRSRHSHDLALAPKASGGAFRAVGTCDSSSPSCGSGSSSSSEKPATAPVELRSAQSNRTLASGAYFDQLLSIVEEERSAEVSFEVVKEDEDGAAAAQANQDASPGGATMEWSFADDVCRSGEDLVQADDAYPILD